MRSATAESAAATVDVAIVVEDGDWPDVAGLLEAAANVAWSVAGDGQPAEVSVALTDNNGIQRLNRDFRGKDKATDVLSFPAGDPLMPDDEALLGDIALALSFIRDEAALENKRFEDHLVHLFVHGMLHLAGHDHEQSAEAVEMENLEKDILARMGINDPYAGRELDSERQ